MEWLRPRRTAQCCFAGGLSATQSHSVADTGGFESAIQRERFADSLWLAPDHAFQHCHRARESGGGGRIPSRGARRNQWRAEVDAIHGLPAAAARVGAEFLAHADSEKPALFSRRRRHRLLLRFSRYKRVARHRADRLLRTGQLQRQYERVLGERVHQHADHIGPVRQHLFRVSGHGFHAGEPHERRRAH